MRRWGLEARMGGGEEWSGGMAGGVVVYRCCVWTLGENRRKFYVTSGKRISF